MSSLGVSYNGSVAPSSVFPQVFSPINTYSILIKINDASAIRELVRANDSFDREDEINDVFPKNVGHLFQYYINVEGNNHNNGFYALDDLLCGLGKISEKEYLSTHDDWESRQQRLETHISLKSQIMKEVDNNDIYTNVIKVLDEEISELEEQEIELRCQYINWEDQNTLIENICINIRKCVYWFFFNENQQKQYTNGTSFIPKISNQTIDLLDNIFNQTDQMETITNKQINQHLCDFEEVNKLCIHHQEQTELGETVELLEATEEEEEENETDNESVWETTSINENENPDKSDASSESSDSTDSEDDEEPLKMDECKKCSDYSYIINQLRVKDEKIKNLEEIIEAQDKQIEEHEEKEESDKDMNYKELEEAYELLNQKRWQEQDLHREIVLNFTIRINEYIDELRILRRQKNATPDNI